MAKTFFMAKSFYRYCALIFRDHGIRWNLAGWIPGGVLAPTIGRTFRVWNAGNGPVAAGHGGGIRGIAQ
jgi:hypothetical protein